MKADILHRILAYWKDKLSHRERHALEKEAQADPFLQDALEGFSQHVDAGIESELEALHARLEQKQKKKVRLLPYWQVAASIVFLLGSITGLYYLSQEAQEPGYITQSKQDSNMPTDQAEVSPREEELQDSSKQKEEVLKTDKLVIAMNDVEIGHEIPEEMEFADEESEEAPLLLTESVSLPPPPPPPSSAITESIRIVEEDAFTVEEKSLTQALLRRVQGIVVDEDNRPLPGVSIHVQGHPKQGTITNTQGQFEIEVEKGAVLLADFIGFQQERIQNPKEQVNIQLRQDYLALSEVVVTGYASSKTQAPVRIPGTASAEAYDSSSQQYIDRYQEDHPEESTLTFTNRIRAIRITYPDKKDKAASPSVNMNDYKKHLKDHYQYTCISPHKVILEFVVSPRGELRDFELQGSPSPEHTKRFIELVKNAPPWTPATENGKTVAQKVRLIIRL